MLTQPGIEHKRKNEFSHSSFLRFLFTHTDRIWLSILYELNRAVVGVRHTVYNLNDFKLEFTLNNYIFI